MTLFASVFPILCWVAYNLVVPLVVGPDKGRIVADSAIHRLLSLAVEVLLEQPTRLNGGGTHERGMAHHIVPLVRHERVRPRALDLREQGELPRQIITGNVHLPVRRLEPRFGGFACIRKNDQHRVDGLVIQDAEGMWLCRGRWHRIGHLIVDRDGRSTGVGLDSRVRQLHRFLAYTSHLMSLWRGSFQLVLPALPYIALTAGAANVNTKASATSGDRFMRFFNSSLLSIFSLPDDV